MYHKLTHTHTLDDGRGRSREGEEEEDGEEKSCKKNCRRKKKVKLSVAKLFKFAINKLPTSGEYNLYVYFLHFFLFALNVRPFVARFVKCASVYIYGIDLDRTVIRFLMPFVCHGLFGLRHTLHRGRHAIIRFDQMSRKCSHLIPLLHKNSNDSNDYYLN